MSAKHASTSFDSTDVISTSETSAIPETVLVEGIILDGGRGIYRVETAAGLLNCTIRGRLRKQLEYPISASAHKRVKKATVKVHDPVAVGDKVRVLPTGGNGGVIEEVIARANGAFTRLDPQKGQGKIRSVSGIDQMIAVFAAREPSPHLRMLDRFLVLAEAQNLAALICINKVDLGLEPWLEERLAVYRAIGYPVTLTSVAEGLGIEELRGTLAGRTSALLGPSGVGKSSLLNALEPELGLRVSAVSASTNKGRHTTTSTRMVALQGTGGYIADTAGIRELSLGSLAEGRLDWCFPEFRPYLRACHHSDCSHLHEPSCAVRAALAEGQLDTERYDSYCRLLGGSAGALDEDWGDAE
ncbi:MAG TPA: ribosome small subunit-dependent GTPase A [Ktedonobacterales bacterium]|nr:ribosome small subunit-dependent GTPase A [Ktedonobacterales bacterium]